MLILLRVTHIILYVLKKTSVFFLKSERVYARLKFVRQTFCKSCLQQPYYLSKSSSTYSYIRRDLLFDRIYLQ